MADETIGIDIILNAGEAATSVKELRQSIKDLQGAALKAGAEGNDALASKFTAAAGKARDRVADLNKEINVLQDTGSKLGALTAVGRNLAGGFAAAAGASVLFGNSQKDVQEQIAKVQAATALLAGVQELADVGKQIRLVKIIALEKIETAQKYLQIQAEEGGIIARNLAAAAQWALNAAMAANPIGAVIVVVAALAVGLYALVTSTDEAAEAAKKHADQLKLYYKVQDEVVKNLKEQQKLRAGGVNDIEREIEVLKAAGASKEEIYKKEQQLLDKKIGDMRVIAAVRVLSADELNELADLNNKKKVLKANFDRENKESEEKNKKEKEQKNKEGKEKQEALDKEAAEKELSLRQQLAQSIVNSIADEREKEIANAQLSFRNRYDAIVGNGQTEIALRAQIKEEERVAMLALDTKFELQDAEKKKAAEEKEKAEKEKAKVASDKEKADEKKKAEDKIKLEMAVRDAKITIAQNTLTSLGAIAKIAGLNGQAALNFQKTLALAQIGIDTATAISGLTRISFSPTHADNLLNPLAPYLKLAAGITSILGSMASAKALLSGSGGAAPIMPSFDAGGGGGGGSAPLTPTSSNVGNTSTTISESGQVVAPMVVKAYVVESEMTQSQLHVKSIVDKSQFP